MIDFTTSAFVLEKEAQHHRNLADAYSRAAELLRKRADEHPSGDDAPPTSSSTAAPQGGSTTAATSPKKHIPFDEKPLSQQAGIRCGDAEFKAFLHYNFPDIFKEAAGDCAAAVRNLCNVNSRTELDIDPSKARTWRNLNDAYETWFITKVHGNTYR